MSIFFERSQKKHISSKVPGKKYIIHPSRNVSPPPPSQMLQLFRKYAVNLISPVYSAKVVIYGMLKKLFFLCRNKVAAGRQFLSISFVFASSESVTVVSFAFYFSGSNIFKCMNVSQAHWFNVSMANLEVGKLTSLTFFTWAVNQQLKLWKSFMYWIG